MLLREAKVYLHKVAEVMENSLLQECKDLGLDIVAVQEHRRKIAASLKKGGLGQCFKVIDTCRIDNGRIFLLEAFQALAELVGSAFRQKHSFLAFVPAAGAASRYIQPLELLLKALAQGHKETVKEQLRALRSYRKVLPREMQPFLDEPEQIVSLREPELARLGEMISLPKAMFPCCEAGPSFLSMKVYEHDKIPALEAQVFVVPVDGVPAFQARLEEEGVRPEKTLYYFEQGPALSTLRFFPDGKVVRENNGQPSLVPAGHGALIKLFPKIRELVRGEVSLFIRNIDNVMGLHPQALAVTEQFLAAHASLLGLVKQLRQLMASSHWQEAEALAAAALRKLKLRALEVEERNFLGLPAIKPWLHLWKLQLLLFQSPIPQAWHTPAESLCLLQQLYRRPVNTLGQVPNCGKDVGGCPVLVATDEGVLCICLERPHADEQSQKEILNDPQKTSHFNPVFVAAELPEGDYYGEAENPFWLLAKKTWLNKEVYYHETVLYEFLGHGKLANCTFVEIPRRVFNPHKSLDDTQGKQPGDWGLT